MRQVQRLTREIIQVAQEQDGNDCSVIGGASPTSIVAAAVYGAVQLTEPELGPTQRAIANAAGVHPASIPNDYRDLLKAYRAHDDN